MTDTIKIESFYHGPPNSGHGGYTSGLIAQLLEAPTVEVTLRKPPPLERTLALEDKGDSLQVMDGGALIAEARASTIDVTREVPESVSYQDAVVASIDFGGFKAHRTPSCFVCGTTRQAREGLRIFPGPVRGRDVVAAALVPESHLAGKNGEVRPEFIWALLDCPSGWAATEFLPGEDAMLGRLTARITRPVQAGKRYAVIGWRLSTEGRKMQSGSAVFDDAGMLHAAARATWIRLAD